MHSHENLGLAPITQLADVSVTYPSGQFETRVVSVGGKSKQQLLARLAEAGVELNEAARILFSSDKFTTLDACQALITVELTVRHLGFTHGARTLELYGKAVALGLCLAPIELGPHLRLQYLDQPEGCWGYPVTEHRAPSCLSEGLGLDSAFRLAPSTGGSQLD